MNGLVSIERIENKVYVIRGQRVMLDFDLASLYGVNTKVLNQAVRRNRGRFPKDFMFQLTRRELSNLRSQFVTSSYGGRRYLPFAFTEHGILMLSSVLNSEKAVSVNIQIMRLFIRMRQLFSSNGALAQKLKELEAKLDLHDSHIKNIFEAIRLLMELPESSVKKIGFCSEEQQEGNHGRTK